ncbi:26093_t:CDS:2, partial [Gigaspora rosea]
ALQNYDEEELADLIFFYGKKRKISNDEYSLIDGEEARKEWDLAKNFIASYRYASEYKFTEYWYKMFKLIKITQEDI